MIKLGWKGGCGFEAEGLCLKEQQQLPLLLEQCEGSEAGREQGSSPDGAGLLLTILY